MLLLSVIALVTLKLSAILLAGLGRIAFIPFAIIWYIAKAVLLLVVYKTVKKNFNSSYAIVATLIVLSIIYNEKNCLILIYLFIVLGIWFKIHKPMLKALYKKILKTGIYPKTAMAIAFAIIAIV